MAGKKLIKALLFDPTYLLSLAVRMGGFEAANREGQAPSRR